MSIIWDSGIIGGGKCVYDAAPDTSAPPTDEAVVPCGVRAECLRKITPGAPDRKTQKMPLRTRRSFTREHDPERSWNMAQNRRFA